MVMNLVSKYDRYQLSDPSKYQIGMQSFLILSAAASQTKVVLHVIDIPFYGGPDLIGVSPFFSSTENTRIGAKILFRVDVYHTSTWRIGTGIVALTFSMTFACVFIIYILDFGTYKLVSYKTVIPFRRAFTFHSK